MIAHWIRNQSTHLFKAAESLPAERRWCLTGTPIQNSMLDLRSLLKFLHHAPFCGSKFFDEHIINPLRREDQNSHRNLKLLLQAICLRRNDTYLNLPPLNEEMVSVGLSLSEKGEYERVFDKCRADFETQVCTGSSKTNYSVLFATIMKLRRLCSHGTLRSDDLESFSLETSWQGQDNIEDMDMTVDSPEVQLCLLCNEEDLPGSLQGITECPLCGRWLDTNERLTLPSGQDLAMGGVPVPILGAPFSSLPLDNLLDLGEVASTLDMGTRQSSKLEAVASNIDKSRASLGAKR